MHPIGDLSQFLAETYVKLNIGHLFATRVDSCATRSDTCATRAYIIASLVINMDTVSILYRYSIATVQYRYCNDTVSILYRNSVDTVSIQYRYIIDIVSVSSTKAS